MADNIMNDNAKDNNADNNVIEFDSKVTEKDLLRFKFIISITQYQVWQR